MDTAESHEELRGCGVEASHIVDGDGVWYDVAAVCLGSDFVKRGTAGGETFTVFGLFGDFLPPHESHSQMIDALKDLPFDH